MKVKTNRILRIAAIMLLAGNLSLQAQNISFNNERVTLKKAFDPNGIMNAGTLIPIKHDPENPWVF